MSICVSYSLFSCHSLFFLSSRESNSKFYAHIMPLPFVPDVKENKNQIKNFCVLFMMEGKRKRGRCGGGGNQQSTKIHILFRLNEYHQWIKVFWFKFLLNLCVLFSCYAMCVYIVQCSYVIVLENVVFMCVCLKKEPKKLVYYFSLIIILVCISL